MLVPLDPSVVDPVEECAYLDKRSKILKIGRTFMDGYKKTCVRNRQPDGLLWWSQCSITQAYEDLENEGYASKRYLTVYGGDSWTRWTETEVPPSLLQSTSSTDCRTMSKRTC